MRHRRLGRTGLQVSEVGLGGHEYRRKSLVKDGRFTILDPARPQIIQRAVDAGVTYFDVTFTEEAQSLGDALRKTGVDRTKLVIAGMSVELLRRLGETESSRWREHIRREVTLRLELLGTDYLDVFHICALESGYQPDRLDVALETFQKLRDQGLIRFAGASAHDPALLERVIRERDPFDVVMAPVSFNQRPTESFLDALRSRDVGLVAMKPLVWFEYGVSFVHLCRRVIDAHGTAGTSAARMALRWVLGYPEVSSVVPAANSPEELLDNVAASDLGLDQVDCGLLDKCRSVPDRLLEMIELIDHPFEEVRSFALAAVKGRLGTDHGQDKDAYRKDARAAGADQAPAASGGDVRAAQRPKRGARGLRSRRRQPAPLGAVTIDEGFWGSRIALLREVTVRAVLDRFERPEGGAFRNFDRVREGKTGEHTGFPWFDGLVYETICAASRLLAAGDDEELERRLDGYIGRIAAAQAAGADGYLATYTMLMAPDKRWGRNGGNLRWQHDVYNAGCLVEAGVAHFQATGKRSLLDVAVRMALHLCGTMGRPPRENIVPAHPLPELALVELYRLFRDRPELRSAYADVRPGDFLRLARFWIDARGFHAGRAGYLPRLLEYAQDHEPLARQRKAVGHAVRATLLYAGLVAVGAETGRHRYLRASRRLWEDVVGTKMAVTGGVGALQEEEMFGPAYYLPNGAYLETCAAVGMASWSHGMSLAFGRGEHADVFERALYNNILAGVSLDGTRFFYRNPLQSGGDHHRWEWHSCPCCPPMLLKLVSELGRCIYALGDRSVTVDHYVAGSARLQVGRAAVTLRQRTRYPWDGRVELAVDLPEPRRFTLFLRLPGWCPEHSLAVNGSAIAACGARRAGYLALSRRWSSGDSVTLALAMPVMLVEANPYVEACRGRVAIQRGPLVYCLEEADNADVSSVRIPAEPELTWGTDPSLPGGMVAVRGLSTNGRRFTAIPYFAWDNRTEGRPNRMAVWIPREGTWDETRMMWSRPDDLGAWEGRLYRTVWSADERP